MRFSRSILRNRKLSEPEVRFHDGFLEVYLEYEHFDLRAHLKTHGFQYLAYWWRFPDTRRLFSADADAIATAFANHGYPQVANELRALILQHGMNQEARIAKSRKAASDAAHPAPDGLSYLPFQIAGIDYMLEHKRVLLADQMGLGKTIQILGLINADPSIRHALIIVPASLRQNWIREARKWLVRPFTVWDASEIRHCYENDPKTKKATLYIEQYHNGSYWAEELARIRDGRLAWRLPNSLVVASYEDVVAMVDPVRKVSRLLDPEWMIAPEPPVITPGLMPAKRVPKWDLFAIDEAHALKAQTATRSKVILGNLPYHQGTAAKESRYCILATGTPIVNRPLEIFKLVNNLDPEFMRYDEFKRRFCQPKKVRRGSKTIVVANGADNLAELDRRLRSTVMLRRLKVQVLKELPLKVRSIAHVPDDGRLDDAKAAYAAYLGSKQKLELATLSDETRQAFAEASIDFGEYCELIIEIEGLSFICDEYRTNARKERAGLDSIPSEAAEAQEALSEAVLRLEALHARLPAKWVAQGGLETDAEIRRILVEVLRNLGKARREVGLAKLSTAIERVQAIAAEEKVVVFAHHQEVIKPLFETFKNRAVLIDGSLAPDKRQDQVNRFQEDPEVRVAVVSIKAGGVGLTLTAAKRLIMAELDWTPAGIEQAEDRIHRIGQTGIAQIEWLYGGEGTADAHIRALVERKEKIIAEGLGDEVDWLPDNLAQQRAPLQEASPLAVPRAEDTSETTPRAAPFGCKPDGTPRRRKPGPGRPRQHDDDPELAKERARLRAKAWRQANKVRATEAKRNWRAKKAQTVSRS